MMNKDSKILITGGTGMVGHALHALLLSIGYSNIHITGSKFCDLRNTSEAKTFFEIQQPDYVFHLAAQVYGSGGNAKYKADVLFNNAMINMNVIEFSRRVGVKKITAMGSGCIYPEFGRGKALTEDQIWWGEPHGSEDSYAHTKRFMLAQLLANEEQYGMDFAYAISGNLYGEYDNFDIENGHVVPVLIAKFYEAVQNKYYVTPWGTGAAIRDFTYGEDAAKALYLLMENVNGVINIGSGNIHRIKDVVDILQKITGMEIKWDKTKSDGQLERYYDLSRLNALGFKAEVSLDAGIKKTYDWYVRQKEMI